MKKVLLTLFLIMTVCFTSAYKKPYKYVIQAEKDAYYHNNMGLAYLKDRIYYAAVQEFKIAISLSPSTQATAVYKNNLGETYMFIGYPDMARTCFEEAIQLYGLNFKYYINLVDCYEILKISQTQINQLSVSDNIYDRIKLGLLYVRTGEKRKGVNVLDEICAAEPDLIITNAIKQYIKEVIKGL